MEKLKIDFVDFYKELDKEDNFFINNLRKVCEVEISNKPELIFYGNYGITHLNYNCYKIFYSAENVDPDFRFCDFSLTFATNSDERNFRLPLYCIHLKDYRNFVKEKNLYSNIKNKFCNFVYSNSNAIERIDFFNLLSGYKSIDSPGKVLNNMPNIFSGRRYDYKSKLEFISNYKFTIAFENESSLGYTTEKIIHPLLVGSIPIYWGNPLVNEEFDESYFINVHKYSCFEEVIEKVKQIDMDYLTFVKYHHNTDFFHGIINLYEKELTDFFKLVIVKIRLMNPVSSSFEGQTDRLKLFLTIKKSNLMKKLNKLRG